MEYRKKIKPFLNWAGGKRWFIANHASLLPKTFNTYIEPFLGSGAVFFHLQPNRAILGDSNKNLILTYKAIKKNWEKVFHHLKKHKKLHSKNHYYDTRELIPRSLEEKAARFIYLNRTCWNGLYRVNQKGQFNVPIGTKCTIIYEDDDFKYTAKLLQKTELQPADFEFLIDQSKENDFLFVDPPYTVKHNNNGFIKYNEKLFSWEDQTRLSEALKRAKDRGSIILCTNACHKSIKRLYKSTFKIKKVSRKSNISSLNATREKYDELLIYS